MTETCGAHYGAHPTKPHLCAVCTLPEGHAGDHDNVLSRADEQTGGGS